MKGEVRRLFMTETITFHEIRYSYSKQTHLLLVEGHFPVHVEN